MTYRGAEFTEMDVDAVPARHPAVAVVDELAHTNVPGCRHPKRWEDVDELLAAGITVVSTVNIQHLESLHEVISEITGITQQETVPDEVVRRAEQMELVDITPEALLRRMAHGNIYRPEKIDAALANYFRPANFTALQELAPVVHAGALDIDLAAKQVTCDGEVVHLTPTEWASSSFCALPDETHYLRVYLAQLRRKLEYDASHPRHLITEPGMGYRFKP